jgi:hypothetical protein
MQKAKLAEVKASLAKGKGATEEAQADVDQIATYIDKLRFDRSTEENAWSEKVSANIEIRQKITHVESRIGKYRLAEKAVALAGTVQDLAACNHAIDRSSSTAAHLRAALAELVEEQNRAVAMRSESSRRMQAEAELTKATASLEVFKLASKAVKARMEQAINIGVGGLFKSAESMTSILMDSPVIFRDGEVGRMVDLRFVPLEMFSGAEAMVTYGALSLALSADAAVRLVIFDEMGRLDPQRKQWLVTRCKELIENGQADQIIMIDTVAEDYYGLTGLTVVKL